MNETDGIESLLHNSQARLKRYLVSKIDNPPNPAYRAPASPLPRFILLTAVRESYLFLANTYGLFHHPALTLTRLRCDRSQFFLFSFALIAFISLISLILYLFYVSR